MGAELASRSVVRDFYGLGAEDRGPDLKGNFEAFVQRLELRRSRAQPVTVIIDGRETGVGKSTLAIALARRLDRRFGLESIAFCAKDLFHLYEVLPPGSIALYDESVRGLLTRRGTRDEEMAGLIGALSTGRKNGIATLLLIPKLTMLDTIVYSGLAPYWIFIEERGRGRVHRAHKGAHYRKSQPRVPYDLWDEVSPLGWRSLDGDPFFEDYKRQAIERNREYFREMAQVSEVKRRRLLGLPAAGSAPSLSGGDVPEREATSPPPPLTWICEGCRTRFTRRDSLERHRRGCVALAARPA